MHQKIDPRFRGKVSQLGQAVLIVIIGIVIVLTIGLSIAAQSIINLQTSNEEERSQQAFSAAEAGIERALQNNQDLTNITLENNAVIKEVTVDDVLPNASSQLLLNNGNPILRNDPVDIWIADYPEYLTPRSGTLTVYWGTAIDCTEAAVEIIVIQGTKAAPQSSRFAYDPCGARAGALGNNFTVAGTGGYTTGTYSIEGTQLRNSAALTLVSGLLVRVVPLYQNTTIGIIPSGGLSLPPQGSRIESIGEVGTTQRKITVFRGFPKLPYEFFPSVIFSP